MIIIFLLAFMLNAVNHDVANSISVSNEKSYKCNYAKIINLKKGAYVSVRSGPGMKYKPVDYLKNNAIIYICDEYGDWNKVFYSDGEGPCSGEVTSVLDGLDENIAVLCKSGWVHRKFIDVISG
jgi:SH3-like domain-containing protein